VNEDDNFGKSEGVCHGAADMGMNGI